MVNRKASRDTICDGWGDAQAHMTHRAREYHLDVGQGEPYDDTWLCDHHATQMCAEWWLVGQFTTPVHIYQNGLFARTEQRTHGIWARFDPVQHACRKG